MFTVYRSLPALLLILAIPCSTLHAEIATAYAPGYGKTDATTSSASQATATATAEPTGDEEATEADDPLCSQNYYKGEAPDFNNPNLSQSTQELCFDGFTVMYSGITRTPLWSAEYLTRDRIERAQALSRMNNFHEETRIDYTERSTLSDYKGSGFDRGHMSPNGDMGTRAQQFNSFSLANIVPQNSYNNQNPWRLLEEATRELVKQEDEAYVITGAAFLGNSLQKIGNVIVPSDIYKAVYFPKRQAVGVYFSPNDSSGQVQVLTLAELNAKIGLDLFPQLSTEIKQKRVNMPLSTMMATRRGDFAGRDTRSARGDNYRNYGVSSESQLQPSPRGLLERLWRALWKLN
ncbi:DNA/RNA non-specific endonuclease [Aquirhabdus parva]|nr:DNA/RNA non-specific endonuclease [Aquirhabdus parva]